VSRNSKKGWRSAGVAALVVVAVVVAVVLWPAPDPLADVETVAVRVGDGAEPSPVDMEGELGIVLGDRNIRVVSDESAADAVLEITDLTVNLGDVEISLSDAGLRGSVSAICTIREVNTGRSHLMDFHLRFDSSGVRADLVGRKFWHVWKRKPAG